MSGSNNLPINDLSILQKMRTHSEQIQMEISVEQMCKRYEALYTAAVNDALREKGYVYQSLPHNIKGLRKNMCVAGPAFTVKGARSLEIVNEMEDRAKMLDSIPEHSVIAWDTNEDNESAHWGEVMNMAAMKRGCRGAVVDGGVRDTNRVLNQNFPVFVRYRSSNGMLGRFRISAWQVSIQIGGVLIRPGDIVFGDIDGVVVIPRDISCEILVRTEEIRENELKIKKWVDEGLSASEIVDRGGYF